MPSNVLDFRGRVIKLTTQDPIERIPQMRNLHLLRTLISIFVVSLIFAAIASGQEITGSVAGTVTDPNGAVVKGATVTITNSDTKLAVRTVNTGDDGQFSVPLLPSGTYDIVVEAQGFKKHVDAAVKVQVNERRTVDVALETGNISETVTVTSTQLQVDTQSAVASNVINGDQVRELSLNNRNWAQLILLSPGVSSNLQDQIYVGTTNPNGVSNALQIAVNGVRPNSNTYTVDGADTTDRERISRFRLIRRWMPLKNSACFEACIRRSLAEVPVGRLTSSRRAAEMNFTEMCTSFWRNDILNANPYLTNRDKPLGVDQTENRDVLRLDITISGERSVARWSFHVLAKVDDQ
jgi:hypothetical protein